MMKLLRLWSADGILVNYTHGYPKRMLDLIEQYRLPAVWLNCRMQRDCLYPDDVAAGRIAAEHLLSQGLKRIAFFDYAAGWNDLDQAHYSLRDRQEGYEQAMHDAGFEPVVIRDAYHVPSAARFDASQRWLDRYEPFEGLIGYSGAQSVELALAMRGRMVGRDYQMVLFSDSLVTIAGGQAPTVVSPNWQMGQRAVQALLDKLESGEHSSSPIALEPELVLPGSSAPRGADEAAAHAAISAFQPERSGRVGPGE